MLQINFWQDFCFILHFTSEIWGLPTALPSHNNRPYWESTAWQNERPKKGNSDVQKVLRKECLTNEGMKRGSERERKCIEEQTAYLKTLIKEKVHPENENHSIIYSTFQICILFFLHGTPTEIFNSWFFSNKMKVDGDHWEWAVLFWQKSTIKVIHMTCGHPLNSYDSFIWTDINLSCYSF